jgi:hypothetical protein
VPSLREVEPIMEIVPGEEARRIEVTMTWGVEYLRWMVVMAEKRVGRDIILVSERSLC